MELKIDPKLITMRDRVGLETQSPAALVNLLAKFAVDDDGESIDLDEARETILDMTDPEIEAWVTEVMASLNLTAVPPQIARNSKNGPKAKARPRSG